MKRDRARRCVAAGLVLVVAVQLSVNWLADTRRPGWRDPEFGVRAHILSTTPEPMVLALGSSRTQMGLDPDSVGELLDGMRLVNLAQAGGRAAGQLIALNRVLRTGEKPRGVLIEVLPAALADSGPVERSLVLSQLSFADLQTLEPYLSNPAAVWRTWSRGRLLATFTFRFHLLSANHGGHLLPTPVRTDFYRKQIRPTGWMPYFFETVSPSARTTGLTIAQAQYAPMLAQFEVQLTPLTLLEAVATQAQACGARVAFVVPPESPTFQRWYPPGAAEKLTAALNQLSQSTGAPVFDARTWPFDETDFADGHHLLRDAAKRFSERLGREHLRPWLADSCVGRE